MYQLKTLAIKDTRRKTMLCTSIEEAVIFMELVAILGEPQVLYPLDIWEAV